MRFAYSTLSIAICSALTSTVFAEMVQDSTQQPNTSVKLTAIVVEANQSNDIGTTAYTKEDLERTPNSQKTISEFLKVNPNVQFSNADKAANSQAELNASDISIHGALPYSNNFLINGMSVNNDINPYAGTSDFNNLTSLSSTSQAFTLNTDLLCNLEVLDSNVSAQYGKFTGGVISATTCAPKTQVGKIHGSLNYDYTNSAWNRFNYIDADEEAEFTDPSERDAQKDFTKQGYSLSTYGRLTESVGINLSLSQRKSKIEADSKLNDARPYNEERSSDNLNLEVFYNPSDALAVKLAAQHYEDKGLRFISNTLTDGLTQKSNGDALILNIDQKLTNVSIHQNLSYQEKKNERKSADNDQFTWYKTADKNWGTSTISTEGVSGDISNEQKTLEYSVNAVFSPLDFLNTQHRFNIGAGFNHTEANWNRPSDFTAYFLPTKFGTDCIKSDGSVDSACHAGYIPAKDLNGQYSVTKTVHGMGSIEVQQDSWYSFIEDRITFNNKFEAVLGLRYDYDSLSKNGNFAPRTAFHYMPFADQRLKFTTGWNRYYDRYLYNLDLQDNISGLQKQYTRTDLNSEWQAKTSTSKVNIGRSELDLPYADEWMLGLSSEFKNIRTQLKYVNRDYKDQYYLVIPDKKDPFTRFYSNDKTYSNESVTFDIANIAPIDILGAKHGVNLAISYSDTKRDFNNADQVEVTEFSHVLYNGNTITPNNLPASDFNVPLTVRLGWEFTPNQLQGLNINNFLVYKPTYEGITKATIPPKNRPAIETTPDNLPIIYSYNDTDIPSVVRWDLRASYGHQLSKDVQAIWGLTINNVTNRHNKYLDSDYYLKSEIGRQFIADITFKF